MNDRLEKDRSLTWSTVNGINQFAEVMMKLPGGERLMEKRSYRWRCDSKFTDSGWSIIIDIYDLYCPATDTSVALKITNILGKKVLVVLDCEMEVIWMERTEMLRALRLFNEKTEKLSNTSFSRLMFGQESGISIHGSINQPLTVKRRGPDQEAIEVFVLTLRFFYCTSEPSAIRSIAEVYDVPLVSSELRERFQEARRALNEYLASDTYHAIQDGKRLTNREVLDTFMWGGLAHANPEKKKLYDSWMAYGELSEIFWNTMAMVLFSFMKILIYIHDLNAEVMVAMGVIP